MRAVEKQVLLQTLDHLWREHLATLDHLRSVIGFRGYAQRDPLNEYKTEGFELFQTLLANLRRAVTGQLAHVEIQAAAAGAASDHSWLRRIISMPRPARTKGPSQIPASLRPQPQARPRRDAKNPTTWGKVGRNEALPLRVRPRSTKQCHGMVIA